MGKKLVYLIIDKLVIALIVLVVGSITSWQITKDLKRSETKMQLEYKKAVLFYQPILYRSAIDNIMWQKVNVLKAAKGDSSRIGIDLRKYLDENLFELVKAYETALNETPMSIEEINAIATLSAHVAAQISCVKILGPNGRLYPKVIGFEYPTSSLDSLTNRLKQEIMQKKN